MKGLENLARMEYPGRFIAIGMDEAENKVVVYGITGRSPSSQAREIFVNDGYDDKRVLSTRPTDEEVLKKGNRALLIYNCVRTRPHGVFMVSNGAQTDYLHEVYNSTRHPGILQPPMETMAKAFSRKYSINDVDVTSYEPDNPNYTPRISGVLNSDMAALHIVKRADGVPEHQIFGMSLFPGKGKLIATYQGKNQDPLPSFEGEPLDILIKGSDIVEIADAFYDAIGPANGKPDFRVSVAALSYDINTGYPDQYIINRSDKQAKEQSL